MKPLADLPEVRFGSKPTDGGFLIVEPEDYDSVMADPIAAKYVRPFRMGRELIHGDERWCLWLEEASDLDMKESPIIGERVRNCGAYRAAAPKGGDAYKLRHTPHLFRPNKNRPTERYIAIPAVFSETRRWATVGFLEPEVIPGNKVFTALDPDGFAFAIISSLMFMTWQKMVGGRLKSDPNFSNTVVWNNLPLPSISEQSRLELAKLGKRIVTVRTSLHPKSLSCMYDPQNLAIELAEAHQELDKAVDSLFGLTDESVTDASRQRALVTSFLTLTRSR